MLLIGKNDMTSDALVQYLLRKAEWKLSLFLNEIKGFGTMRKRGISIIFLVLLTIQGVWAGNNISFTASARRQVLVGQQFQVLFEVNANGRSFTPPADFGGLEILSGPNTSSSSSIQFINGKMSQSYTMTYSYIVMATKPGDVTIGPASIRVKGRRYTSNTLKIKVLKDNSSVVQKAHSSGAVPNRGGATAARRTQPASSTATASSKDVFVKATANNTRPYLGQQVVVTYRIYTRVPVSNLSINKVASFKGFWSKDLLGDKSTVQQHSETINGKQYVVAVIRKLALIPQQSGKLTIDPMELNCAVQVRIKNRSNGSDPFDAFFNDPFFNQNVRTVQKKLVSNALTFKVRPLPEKGKPACFKGAVGNFSFKNSVDKTNLTANDALTLEISISGSGNIELTGAPQVKFPSDFETYDPKISSKINTSVNGVSGTKKFDYLAIPRTAGDFIIKPVKFCYFNPKDRRYHVFQTKTYHIHVKKGKGTGVVYAAPDQQGIHFLGKDIRHIKEGPFDLQPMSNFFFGTTLYYVLLALPVVLLLLLLLLWNLFQKRRANVSLVKNRKAQKVARGRLTKAQKMKKQGDDRAFYDEIAQALWGYISDKFNLQKANLSMDTVKELLEQKQVDTETIQAFMDTLNSIEYARFAPGDTKGKMENIYTEALHAIMHAEKSLK